MYFPDYKLKSGFIWELFSHVILEVGGGQYKIEDAFSGLKFK